MSARKKKKARVRADPSAEMVHSAGKVAVEVKIVAVCAREILIACPIRAAARCRVCLAMWWIEVPTTGRPPRGWRKCPRGCNRKKLRKG